jgi:hypothetical protein
LADLRDVGSTAEAKTVHKALARITRRTPARVAALPKDLGTGSDDVDFD